MFSEIMKKIKKKKQKKLEEQKLTPTPEIRVGMTVCVERQDAKTFMNRAEIGVIVAVDAYSRETFLVKFKDGSVNSYDADAIYTDYNKELLK